MSNSWKLNLWKYDSDLYWFPLFPHCFCVTALKMKESEMVMGKTSLKRKKEKALIPQLFLLCL